MEVQGRRNRRWPNKRRWLGMVKDDIREKDCRGRKGTTELRGT